MSIDPPPRGGGGGGVGVKISKMALVQVGRNPWPKVLLLIDSIAKEKEGQQQLLNNRLKGRRDVVSSVSFLSAIFGGSCMQIGQRFVVDVWPVLS